MEKIIKNILKQISYREILAVLLVFIGIIFIVISEEITIKIIAICISFFGAVALVNIIAQKITYSVQHDKFKIKPAVQLKTTVISDTQAKRTTIDNFEVTTENKETAILDFLGADEGFVIVNKATDPVIEQKDTSNNNPNNDESKTELKVQKSYAVDFTIAKNISESESPNTNTNTGTNTNNNTTSTDIDINNKITQENIQKKAGDSDSNEEEFPDAINTSKSEEAPEENIEIKSTGSVESNDDNTPKNIFENSEKVEELKPGAAGDKSEVEDSNEEDVSKNKNIVSEQSHNSAKAKKIDISKLVVSEDNNDFKNPIEEFGYLVSRFLVIIRSVIEANTIAFVWVNYEKRSLLFDAYMSSQKVQSAVKKNTQIPLGSDILSQIASSAKPEILTEINSIAELDLIPYYEKPIGTSSFIGIPIIFEQTVVGILCADTDKKDAYDQSTAVFLGQFTRLLSTLFASYSNKFSFVNAAKALDMMNKLTNMIADKDCTFSQICSAITELISQTYDCTSVGVCTYNDKNKNWFVCSYKSMEQVEEEFFETPIELSSSLIGMSISESRKISIAQISDEYTRVNDFDSAIDNGSFVAIPIKSVTDTYGALFMEAKASSILATIELEVVEAVCNLAGELYEKLNLISLFNSNVTIDRTTGILNNKALQTRIKEELARFIDTNSTISMVLISLDKYSSFEDKNKKNKIINYLISECRNYLKSYDIIGRVNDDVIGIININKDANQVKLYVERVRHQIATKFIEINSEKVVLTVSAGIVTAMPGDTFDTFTTNATIALQNAQTRGNYIQIFQ